MRKDEQQLNVQELFDSLSPQEQEQIKFSIYKEKKSREEERYKRLQAAETAKNKIAQELDHIEYEITENDDWFIEAKEHKIKVTTEARNLHRKKAGDLYFQKKKLKELLLEAEININAIISKIEKEEAKETLFQRRDLEQLMLPFHEKRERERRQIVVAQAGKERMIQREEEARRQEEYEALLNRLGEKIINGNQAFEDERRKKWAEDIRAQIDSRKIPYLVHFTPINNVKSILDNGLRSRNALAGHEYKYTDEYRSDGWLDWISLSVSFPNYKMFYSKRKSKKDIDGWAILLIKTDVLWELDCKFIPINASSFDIRRFPDDKWSSAEAFKDMFNHVELRREIPDHFTTDPQAEVMVRNEVSRHYIDMIAVERQSDLIRLYNLEKIRVKEDPNLFKWRSDFEHWRKSEPSPFPSHI
jgi:hypothetical protein